jgi:hypothetical protein
MRTTPKQSLIYQILALRTAGNAMPNAAGRNGLVSGQEHSITVVDSLPSQEVRHTVRRNGPWTGSAPGSLGRLADCPDLSLPFVNHQLC